MDQPRFSRRTALALGAGAALTYGLAAAQPDTKEDELRVAIIGCGAQGGVMAEALHLVPGLRVVAICDIWDYATRYASRMQERFGNTPRVYGDYQELLAKEDDLDAVCIATPDWVHAEHTIACLRAGLHVYCEPPIANSLDDARAVIQTAREEGRLLQIGYQRRSNPRYINAIDAVLHREQAIGRINQARVNWHVAYCGPLGWPRNHPADTATLAAYGYESMDRLRNWRWFGKYSVGRILGLCGHQLDVCNWVFGGNPKAVAAVAGKDLDPEFGYENYDSMTGVFEYDTESGPARATVELLSTTGLWGHREVIFGRKGALEISELPGLGNALQNPWDTYTPEWEKLAEAGLLDRVRLPRDVIDARASHPLPPLLCPLRTAMYKPFALPPIENFVDAIRNGTPLQCPGETAYAVLVAMLCAIRAAETDTKQHISPEEYQV